MTKMITVAITEEKIILKSKTAYDARAVNTDPVVGIITLGSIALFAAIGLFQANTYTTYLDSRV